MAEVTIRISDKVFKIVGVIVVGLCLARLGLYIWSSGILLPVYSLQMYLPESDGLAAGAPVRLDGI
jgi:ABC-type transporter Mla subunit MlaD